MLYRVCCLHSLLFPSKLAIFSPSVLLATTSLGRILIFSIILVNPDTNMKKLDIDSKGKQRQRSDENDDNDDMHIDVSLKAFIAEQADTLQSPLIVPTQEELGCGDAEYRRVVKAVRHIQCVMMILHQPDPLPNHSHAALPSMLTESED